ncbi:MAG: pyruvate formate-lyase 1-activating enzyme [Tenericutes bacterium GWC2_34_14]|nr:MAG: pyruvate formate-lyase 1-activating enzyme [Tenericutes bacterium GWA2_35_7]OHE29864.1 MAG: pyruvate formate-lyase 1-activating enzyme [Tenericutes bacterium GWC2_34_14]OHE34843.1 MAG: pyruvate formate-lyase 1-activating enzyme [Tenericutes bacterium GWE2_34_108]OHE37296.1 MAG: pyruvate formate-lyase 1-activating enzyme [Tenericutes bacterium GWF1_35_14]OHE39571.1 MAG: pyruvate formate-lyase 1-activating enzyme [Tenericutes bacterium GWF2_35_184]OHE43161.1 MAG: pyruvate formate-lyase 1
MNLSKDVFANVHHIETFGTFDGPGIRYVLFLQGCPFQCQYCHNRDSWSTDKNKIMTSDEVLSDFEKFSHFYKNGGITVSGGEPLLQIHFLIDLFKKAKQRNIHTCLDTAGGTYHEKHSDLFIELMRYTDLVLLDLKQINEAKHLSLTKQSNTQVLAFARFLNDIKKKVIIRHVLVPTITDDETDLKNLRLFLDGLSNVSQIEILPYHKSGIHKWKNLGFTYELEHIQEPTKQMVENAKIILTKGYKFNRQIVE